MTPAHHPLRPPRLAAILRLAACLALSSSVASASLAQSSDSDTAAVVPVDANAPASPDFTFTAAGDYGATNNTRATLNGVRDLAPDFHLALGDLSYGTLTPESAWCNYVNDQLGGATPVLLVAGNREDDSADARRVDQPKPRFDAFADCLQNSIASISGSYAREYYFDYPSAQPIARFIVLPAGLKFGDQIIQYVPGDAHYNWLSSAIDNARQQGIQWIIVAAHKPCLTIASGGCTSGVDLMNLLIQKRVSLVLHAHEHAYQRTWQLGLNSSDCKMITPPRYNAACVVAGAGDVAVRDRGTVFVIAGTGGEGLTTVNQNNSAVPYFAAFMGANTDATFGYLEVHVSTSELRATFDRARGGNFSDSFSIQAGP